MSLITAYYGIYEHRDGEFHVRYMTPDVDGAMKAFVALGGRIDQKQWAGTRNTLLGRAHTTDHFPASPRYSSGHKGLFLSVSRESLTQEEALATERHRRRSQAMSQALVAPDANRRRMRP